MSRRFTNPVKRIPRRHSEPHRTFRRNSSADGTCYRRDGFASTDLHPQELDAVLLAILRSVYDLLGRSVVSQDIDLPVWASLKAIRAHYRNQVLVDEATPTFRLFSWPVWRRCLSRAFEHSSRVETSTSASHRGGRDQWMSSAGPAEI